MDELKRKLIHLSCCRYLSWKTIYKLLQDDSSLKQLYSLTPRQFHQITNTSLKNSETIISSLHTINIDKVINHLNNSGVKVSAIYEKSYPLQLKQIFQPPWLLYLKGDAELLNNNKNLSIVGTRNITSYGYEMIKKLLPEIIEKDFTIVSGLARGVDKVAHEVTIQLGGRTIAVIAGGFNNLYPKENIPLAHLIMKNHLMISEHPPHIKPIRSYFPLRNRIIAGLSPGTFVVEAGKRSGSFITADYALNEGREVFALPGNLTNEYSAGTNNLIQKGAKLVMKADDIIEELLYFNNYYLS